MICLNYAYGVIDVWLPSDHQFDRIFKSVHSYPHILNPNLYNISTENNFYTILVISIWPKLSTTIYIYIWKSIYLSTFKHWYKYSSFICEKIVAFYIWVSTKNFRKLLPLYNAQPLRTRCRPSKGRRCIPYVDI